MRRRHRAYALPLTLMLAGILAAAFTLYVARLEGMTSTQRLALKRRQAFYAADAVARAAVEVASPELSRLPPPDDATAANPALLAVFEQKQIDAVQAVLDARKADFTPAGYLVHSSAVGDLGERKVAELKSGPFKGMIAQQQPFSIAVEVSHTGDGGSVASMKSQVVRGTISMFQFFTFIDGYAYLYTGSGTRYAGRTHANGNICIGSGNDFYVERATASGGFYVSRSKGCRKEKRYHESERGAVVATRPLVDGLAQLACTIGDTSPASCVGLWQRAGTNGKSDQQFDRDGNNDANDGTPYSSGTDRAPAEWRTASLARWNGQVQDSAHGVTPLRVPISGIPVVQAGRDASHNLVDNTTKSRFLIDPMLANEPADVRSQKLAFKADIRILNGVWYVRDPAQPQRLGRPIWSDHPGDYRRHEREDVMVEDAAALDGTVRAVASTNVDSGRVGQQDLFAANARPKRFSYYQTAANSKALITVDTAARPVISYGNLRPTGTGASKRWYPGYLAFDNANKVWRLQDANTVRKLLQGTRSGFRDGWMQVGAYRNDADTGNTQRANLGIATTAIGTVDGEIRRSFMFNMLPTNFDVEAFAAALKDTSARELGSYFTAAAPFNGVVWIGNTWPGIERGYSNAFASTKPPEFWPFQGRQTDPDQPGFGASSNMLKSIFDSTEPLTDFKITALERPRFSTSNDIKNVVFQTALPFNLCTDVDSNVAVTSFTSTARGSLSSDVDTLANTTTAAEFRQSPCARYLDRDITDTKWGPTPQGGFVAASATNFVTAARSNSVRVHNGRDIDRVAFPKGLTIATNLPVYLLGDFNSTSVAADKPSAARSILSTKEIVNWRPALIAADTVAYQSADWSDEGALWNVGIDTSKTNRARLAASTVYNFEVLAGWLESDGRGNRDEVTYFTRLLEDWAPAGRTERGSRVIGFASSFGLRFDWNGESNGDSNAGKLGAYDYHLDLPENQPPGAPRFQVTAIETFVRN